MTSLAAVSRFTRHLEQKAETAGEAITLVGWSLGSVIAREAARGRAGLVAQVITLGSPIHAVIDTLHTKATRSRRHQ